MANQEFNYRHPFETKCGWPARLVGVLNRRAFPLVVAVHNPAFGAEELHCYALDGQQPMRAVYATGAVAVGHEGAIDGALSLVNTEWWTDTPDGIERVLKCTDLVHAVHTHDQERLPINSNPLHYDLSSMQTPIVRGWSVLHEGYDRKESPSPLTHMILYNARSGQRIFVSLMTVKENQDG